MTHLLKIGLLATVFALSTVTVAQESVRFPDLRPDQYSPAQKQLADLVAQSPRNGKVTNPPYKVYFRSPDFGLQAIRLSDYLRWGTSLGPRLTELTILIAARQWSSGYIWHAHYPLAIKGGLDPKIPAAMAKGQRPEGMKEDETIIYDLITQIYRDKSISDATYNAAVAKFGKKGVTDTIGIASYYGITAMSLIAAKETFPAGDEPKLQAVAQVFPK
jgi:4-carboxymuconolactone decarboxylase